MDSKSINSLIEASANSYADDLRAYQLSPRGSPNGFTEHNIQLAIAKQVTRQESTLGWRSYVEVPFNNKLIQPKAEKRFRKLNAMLDLLLIGTSGICFIECKQFGESKHAGPNGIERDLKRLTSQPDSIESLISKRLGNEWSGRKFVLGILDCWSEKDVQYIMGKRPLRNRPEFCSLFTGWESAYKRIDYGNDRVEYYWVWGVCEIPMDQK